MASAEAEAAVKKTAGQVLLIGGIVLKPAFFHSSCGGHTSSAIDVFGEDVRGLGGERRGEMARPAARAPS